MKALQLNTFLLQIICQFNLYFLILWVDLYYQAGTDLAESVVKTAGDSYLNQKTYFIQTCYLLFILLFALYRPIINSGNKVNVHSQKCSISRNCK